MPDDRPVSLRELATEAMMDALSASEPESARRILEQPSYKALVAALSTPAGPSPETGSLRAAVGELRETLDVAREFIERVTMWNGTTPEDRAEVLEEITATLDGSMMAGCTTLGPDCACNQPTDPGAATTKEGR